MAASGNKTKPTVIITTSRAEVAAAEAAKKPAGEKKP